jgi:MoaA/NifB/PqqE/SkfB family radical SAM enzyme
MDHEHAETVRDFVPDVTEADAAAEGRARLAHLAQAYLACNRLTGSAASYRDPDEILQEAGTIVATLDPAERAALDAEAGSAGALPLLMAVLAVEALDRGDGAGAARYLRRALVSQQNNLHLQTLLRRAEGATAPDRFDGQFCRAPFENLETTPSGDVHFCCPAWLPKPIGNLKDATAEEIWNSPAARDIRASIHDGSYRHCSRMHCPKLSGGGLEPRDAIRSRDLKTVSDARRVRLDRGPRNVILSHDRSCNLACPSCRTGLILARKAEQEDLNGLADRVLFPLLAGAARVRITASGDPFGSAHFQYVMRNIGRCGNPALRIDLQTNGLLLTERLWSDLALEGRVGALMVSIDAARPETYARVRRPGRFEVLAPNLAFFARLRAEGRIARLRFDFVVQGENWREMSEFVTLARAHGADGVKFQMIRSWGTFTVEEFAAQDVAAPGHPNHADFQSLAREVMRERPFVEFWGLPSVADAGSAETP